MTPYDKAIHISTELVVRTPTQIRTEIGRRFNEFVELVCWSGISGVYMIDGHYIGRTNNITDRIPTHIAESFRQKHPVKCQRILERLKVGPLRVIQLSLNEEDEMGLIRQYKDAGHDLSNLVVEQNYGPTPEFLFWHGFIPCKGSLEREGKVPFPYIGVHHQHKHLYASHTWVYDSVADKSVRPDALAAHMKDM